MSHISIGQPILVQDYILHVLGKPFLDGNRFRVMGLNKKFSASPDWMSHAQLTFI